MSRFRVNSTTTRPIIYAGTLDNEGRCTGAAYSDPYGNWESVVVQGTLKIKIQEQKARVDLNNNVIHLRSGRPCILSEATCLDVEGAHTFCNTVPINNCKFNQYSILYKGYANRIDDLAHNHIQTVYSLVTDEVTFAIMISSTENVCAYLSTGTV